MSYPYDYEPYVAPGRFDGLIVYGLLALSAAIFGLAAIGGYTVYGWLAG